MNKTVQKFKGLIKSKKFYIALAGFFILIAAFFLLGNKFSRLFPFSAFQETTKTVSQPTEIIVEITATGFSPQTIKIKSGDQVSFINQDSKPHQIKSDPHPADNLYPFLNTDEILMTNESVTLPFEQSGTFTYHDELNPLEFKGIIIID